MTKRSLRIRFQWVIAIYFAAIVAAIAIRIFDNTREAVVYSTYKDLIPLLIALPAAWLGYCLQRRNSYMQQLRSLWSKLVETIQHANQYTYLDSPTKEQHATSCQKISIAIDEIRGVFMNLGESSRGGYKSGKGLYPFEPIKDIHKAVTAVGHGETATREALLALRKEIFRQWKMVRDELLKEFDREEPTHFHSRYVTTIGNEREC